MQLIDSLGRHNGGRRLNIFQLNLEHYNPQDMFLGLTYIGIISAVMAVGCNPTYNLRAQWGSYKVLKLALIRLVCRSLSFSSRTSNQHNFHHGNHSESRFAFLSAPISYTNFIFSICAFFWKLNICLFVDFNYIVFHTFVSDSRWFNFSDTKCSRL